MILTGHQPNYLPYTGFFEKIAKSKVFCIVDTVQFVKRGTFGWHNRNKIRTHDDWVWLSVPVLTKGNFEQKISQARINNDVSWARKHYRSIYLNYHKARYFSKYSNFFEEIYTKKSWEYLKDLNEAIIGYIIKSLGIKVKIVRCSDLKIYSGKTQLIVDMCKKLKADTYISGVHGKDYIEEALLKKNRIKLIYQDFRHPVYQQQFEGFLPNMSVIDLMFNHGPKSLDIIVDRKTPKRLTNTLRRS